MNIKCIVGRHMWKNYHRKGNAFRKCLLCGKKQKCRTALYGDDLGKNKWVTQNGR